MITEFVIGNFISFISIIVAGFLAFNNKDGWGWFLLIAILTFHTYTHKKKDT
jgi:hypothetical protein